MKIFVVAVILFFTSCKHCITCGTKAEGEKYRKIRREARKMERQMMRQQKKGN